MRFFVGTYTGLGGPGVAVCQYEKGALSQVSAVREMNDPIYIILSHDQRYLFAAGAFPESDEGAVASYAVEGDRLTLISMQPTDGLAPCHLTLSADGRFLYCANYISGSITAFPVEDGRILPYLQLVQHEGHSIHPTRQTSAHTHQCVFRPESSELFVCDLGMDAILVYNQDGMGQLSLRERIPMPAGMGPRHLVFASRDLCYVVGELDNTARRLIYQDGAWHVREAVSTLPVDFVGTNTAAAIRLHDGALWVSNRGHNSLCRIQLDVQGRLGTATWQLSHGLLPRDFVFTPHGLLFANQGSGIADGMSYMLSMPGAVCIEIMNEEA